MSLRMVKIRAKAITLVDEIITHLDKRVKFIDNQVKQYPFAENIAEADKKLKDLRSLRGKYKYRRLKLRRHCIKKNGVQE